MIKHKKGKSNVVVDAFSRRYALFSTLETKFIGLSTLKNCMTMIQILLLNILHVYILLKMGCFDIMTICSKKKRLCVPKGSMRRLLVKEAHAGGLMGAFWGSKDFRHVTGVFILVAYET